MAWSRCRWRLTQIGVDFTVADITSYVSFDHADGHAAHPEILAWPLSEGIGNYADWEVRS
jgi:hypothetical protein